MSEKDVETRTRVLTAAARLFAGSGFEKVTVREICRAASANIAAVNYHFGDKVGLYQEVLGMAIETMQGTTAAARREGEGRTAEEKLRIYIRVFLQRVAGTGDDSWIHQLMAHEMADPTPALDMVVDQVIRPRVAYMSELVGEMLGLPVADDRVLRCVVSIQSQCHAVMKNPVSRKFLPDYDANPAALDRLATHIAEFSLGGIHALHVASGASFVAPLPADR